MSEHHYHFWCENCKHEYSEAQAERRETDGIWGEGRWWFCPRCGVRLKDIPVLTDQDQAILAAATTMLVRLEKQEPVPPAEIYALLLEIGHAFLPFWGNHREACLYFYNAHALAQKNDLPESVRAEDYKYIAYRVNIREEQYQVLLPLPQLLEDYLRYFLPL